MEFVYYMAVFVAGGLASIALAMAINKDRGLKKKDRPEKETLIPTIRVHSLESIPITAEVHVPMEAFVATGKSAIKVAVESELQSQLSKEIWNYVEVEMLENPMSMERKYTAKIRVVKF